LQSLAEHYVHWLRQHEQRGWRVASMEESKQTELPLFMDDAGHAAVSLQLYGQLDRVDERPNDQGRQAWVVDYKTGSLQSLKRKVLQPMEDTQLAFYALLTEGHDSVNASYLHLDDRACTDLPHEDVETTAQALSEGMRQDFERIWMGHAMPALGEGSVCDFCDARGLCRKDHWPPSAGRPADTQEARA
jgi:ATP-dependent helicase/nuclease subunit B